MCMTLFTLKSTPNVVLYVVFGRFIGEMLIGQGSKGRALGSSCMRSLLQILVSNPGCLYHLIPYDLLMPANRFEIDSIAETVASFLIQASESC